MTIISAIILAFLMPFVLFDVIRRPSIRRIGMRNVTRRTREAALVVGGSLLATALITASFVIGDSFDASVRNVAVTHYGPTDEIVDVASPAEAELLATSIQSVGSADIDGVLPATLLKVAAGSVGEDRRVEPTVRLIELDLERAALFGGDQEATGLAGLQTGTINSNSVIINNEMAKELGLKAGDPIDLFANGQPHRFSVAAVVPIHGLAGIGQMLVQPGALTNRLDNAVSISRPVVLVSNTGGVFAGAERTAAARLVIEDAGSTNGGAESTVSIDEVKQDLIDIAEADGAEMTQLFGTIGGFSVIAGILLVINLFVMLASERKSELGTMRALGMSRGSIVRGFALEGAIYGALAAVLGAVAGIGVGVAVVAYASAASLDGGGVVLSPSIQFSSLVSGALIGLAISQLTVLFTSIKMTKLNIVRALKDLPEPAGHGHRKRNLVFGLVGLLAAGALWVLAGDSQLGALAAPVIAALAAIPLLARVIPGKVAATVGCAAGMIWAATVFGVLGERMNDPEISVFLLQGVVLVGLGSVIVAVMDGVWLKLADRITGGGVGTKLGMAHPLARPVRSVMLVAMFALVLFTVTFISVLNAVFQAQGPEMAHRVGGGYEMIVDSNPASGYTVAELEGLDGVALATPVRRSEIEIRYALYAAGESVTAQSADGSHSVSGESDGGSMRVSFVEEGFDQITPPATAERAEVFASDREAWDAVLNGSPDGELWIMAPDFDGVRAGQTVTMFAEDGTEYLASVAGTVELGWMVGAGFYAPVAWQDVLVRPGADSNVDSDSWAQPTTRFYLDVAPGSNPQAVAAALTAAAPERGLDARAFTDAAQEALDSQSTFLNMLQGYLGLGLLIGVAGLSVVLVRAVRERRRQIGVMRAIGISSSRVRSMFVVEALFIGVQGVILGLGLGTLSSWQILTKSTAFEKGLGFTIPGLWITGLGLAALFFSVLAAIGPAMLAGRESPAEALRFSG